MSLVITEKYKIVQDENEWWCGLCHRGGFHRDGGHCCDIHTRADELAKLMEENKKLRSFVEKIYNHSGGPEDNFSLQDCDLCCIHGTELGEEAGLVLGVKKK